MSQYVTDGSTLFHISFICLGRHPIRGSRSYSTVAVRPLKKNIDLKTQQLQNEQHKLNLFQSEYQQALKTNSFEKIQELTLKISNLEIDIKRSDAFYNILVKGLQNGNRNTMHLCLTTSIVDERSDPNAVGREILISDKSVNVFICSTYDIVIEGIGSGINFKVNEEDFFLHAFNIPLDIYIQMLDDLNLEFDYHTFKIIQANFKNLDPVTFVRTIRLDKDLSPVTTSEYQLTKEIIDESLFNNEQIQIGDGVSGHRNAILQMPPAIKRASYTKCDPQIKSNCVKEQLYAQRLRYQQHSEFKHNKQIQDMKKSNLEESQIANKIE